MNFITTEITHKIDYYHLGKFIGESSSDDQVEIIKGVISAYKQFGGSLKRNTQTLAIADEMTKEQCEIVKEWLEMILEKD